MAVTVRGAVLQAAACRSARGTCRARRGTARCDSMTVTVWHTGRGVAGGGVSFSAWDVSGAARHRALWERHYRRAHALIFVVDAADHLRLGQSHPHYLPR
ncbi:hypothetical protein HF086_005949 [Spodoptera exigua]|uniref:Uncharacterized protein n=1 Tax=Spodoptera exigua TaxID=7107 RepID=A0A922MUV9_SPOEX|nr:hypothetical protein HF086_005949 [Spodoptera exigua]